MIAQGLARLLTFCGLAILGCGQASPATRGHLDVFVAFPDQDSLDNTRRLGVLLLAPGTGANCHDILVGQAQPGDLGYLMVTQSTIDLTGSGQTWRLENVNPDRYLFMAEGYDASQYRFLLGCTEARVEDGGQEVVIVLQKAWRNCETNEDCHDQNFCNGIEQCIGGFCAQGLPPRDICADALDQDCDGVTDGCCLDRGSFVTGENFNTSSIASDVLAEDFNEDGIFDLALAEQGWGGVQIFMGQGSGGQGDGSFMSLGKLMPDEACTCLTAADFNLDGHLDLAIGISTEESLAGGLFIASGNGNGTFDEPLQVAGISGLQTMVSGDFNNDRIPDLVVSSSRMAGSILLGVGDASFVSNSIGEILLMGMAQLLPGDFNSDGILDLAGISTGLSGSIHILLGEGKNGRGLGEFREGQNIAVGAQLRTLAAVDFNSDGITDLTAIGADQSNQDDVILFLLTGIGSAGEGTGRFRTPDEVSLPFSAASLAVADLNADSIIDLVLGYAHTPDVSIFAGSGSDAHADGDFSETWSSAAGVDSDVNGVIEVLPIDVNGDRILDLVTLFSNRGEEFQPGFVTVYAGQGSGSLASGKFDQPAVVFHEQQPQAMAVGDFNADAILDVAVGLVGDTPGIQILISAGSNGRGSGEMTIQSTINLPSRPLHLASADFNADHILDLAAVVESGEERLVIIRGQGSGGRGDGTFDAPKRFATDHAPVHLTVLDANSDHIPDLALTDTGAGSVSIWNGLGTNGQGTGNFSFASEVSAGQQPLRTIAADLNGDRILDLAVLDPAGPAIRMLVGEGSDGRGDGTFAPTQSVEPAAALLSMAIADINADHRPDLIAGTEAGISSFPGDGHGGFSQAQATATEGPVIELLARDVNQDHIVDLVVATMNPTAVSVYLGQGVSGHGDGTFARHQDLALINPIKGMVFSDFDGDRSGDLLLLDTSSLLVGFGQRTCPPSL